MNKIEKIKELKNLLDSEALSRSQYDSLLKEILASKDISENNESFNAIDNTKFKSVKKEIRLDLGVKDSKVRLVKWLKNVGSNLKKNGDSIAEVETDKAILEITSAYEGVLIEHSVLEGEIVKNDQVLAVLETDKEACRLFHESLNSLELESCTIGYQEWMTDNLKVKYFRNGDIINEASTPKEWLEAEKKKEPAWGYYNDDPINENKYGLLYNHWAISDIRKIAPKGWKVPNENDWETLIKSVGGDFIAGKSLKSRDGWKKILFDDNDNESLVEGLNGTDKYGFNALPAGYLVDVEDHNYRSFSDEGYADLGLKGVWACSGEGLPDFVLRGKKQDACLIYGGIGIATSVRCIKDNS